MAHLVKRVKVICPYCNKPYLASNGKSRYGCYNWECNVKAQHEKEEYNRERMRTRWGKTAKAKQRGKNETV